MKGDFSRVTFDPHHRYSRVLMQQGRVQTDADFNEQADIQVHALRRLAADLIGPHAGPGDSFAVIADDDHPYDFAIQWGSYYVEGIRCENAPPPTCALAAEPGYEETRQVARPVRYKAQPDLPEPAALETGRYLVYLDVWERHITYVQNDGIREVALGGPDTATRSKVVWQVKVTEIDAGADCEEALQRHREGASSCLSARARVEQPSDDPCIIPPEARYRGPENQLYRVEIHKVEQNRATFKWSRDNGSLVYPIESLEGATAILEHLGRDDRQRLRIGDWVEVSDDERILKGIPGPLLKVAGVDSAKRKVTLETPPGGDAPSPYETQSPLHPLLRRWDQTAAKAAPLTAGAVPLEERKWIDLEDGVQIRFRSGGSYRSGDYWLIPARTATRDVEWPRDDSGKPLALPPRGVFHRYAPLARIRVDGEGKVRLEHDCRRILRRLWVAAAEAPAPVGPVEPPPAPTEEISVREIDGVGQQFQERLAAAGIRNARQVAELEPARLAQILGASEARAVTIIQNARRLVSG